MPLPMDNPFEPTDLTPRQRRIGEARDAADREYDLTGDRTLPIAVGLFPERGLMPEQTERMWAHREKLYREDALALRPGKMAAIKARLEAKANGGASAAAG